LFIVGGAFVHLDKIISKRLGKTTIGFTPSKKKQDNHDLSFLLSQVEPEDLVEFGLIPEFIGRFNSISNCSDLTVEDLVEILEKPKNAIIKQYTYLFKEEEVKLNFTEGALRAIAEKAKKTGTGARALRMIVENLLRDLMYEVPSDPSIEEITIEKETVVENKEPIIRRK
jgi:ATP-dependent Clp protease ATP-binding subunit ClpX